jgi:Domain of unknown function (DUF4105)
MKGSVAVLLLFVSTAAFSQSRHLSDKAQISLLTLGPDQEEFYEAFGHSAIRLYDPVLGLDYACNYGMFSFNQPNFYLNFAKGHLNYSLGIQPYPDFRDAYIYYNRFIHEQVLNLSQEQKQKLFEFFQWNAREANKYYLYDYFFNNCSTKIRDIFKDVLKDDIQYDQSFIKTNYTIRQLTDLYLEEQPWGDLGIDIGLGSRIDKTAIPYEYMFLPDYLEYSFDHARIRINGVMEPLVSEKKTVFTAQPDEDKAGWLNPWIVFTSVLLLTLAVSYYDWKRKKLSTWIDFLFLAITGFLGIVLLLLWLATDHHATARNYNLLWALPTNLVAAIAIFFKRRPAWLTTYFLFMAILTILILGTWKILPQQINGFLYPLLVAFAARYLINWQLKRKEPQFVV